MLRLFTASLMLLTIFAARPVVAGEAHWETDLDAAVKLAKKRNTVVMALFTGSDWCPPCKAFEASTLSTADFATYATKNLVLAKFDIPNGTFVSAQQKAYNRNLMAKYEVRGVPTVILFGPDGNEIKRQVGGQSMDQLQRWCDSAISDKGLKPITAAEVGVEVADSGYRVWKDRRGRTVSATLVTIKPNSVVMKTRDGKEYDVPLEQLSDEDLAYVKKQKN